MNSSAVNDADSVPTFRYTAGIARMPALRSFQGLPRLYTPPNHAESVVRWQTSRQKSWPKPGNRGPGGNDCGSGAPRRKSINLTFFNGLKILFGFSRFLARPLQYPRHERKRVHDT
jgi:hypothetical protein